MLASMDGDVVEFLALAFADYWGEFDDFGAGSENDGDFRLLIRSFQCFLVKCTVGRLGIFVMSFVPVFLFVTCAFTRLVKKNFY